MILHVARSNTLKVTPSTCNSHGREKAEASRIKGWRVQGQEGEEKALSDKNVAGVYGNYRNNKGYIGGISV